MVLSRKSRGQEKRTVLLVFNYVRYAYTKTIKKLNDANHYDKNISIKYNGISVPVKQKNFIKRISNNKQNVNH